MPARRTKSPVSGIKPDTKRLADGRRVVYWYHRATGKRILKDPNSAAGLEEIRKLDERAARLAAGGGSLKDIIAAYQAPDAAHAGKGLGRIRPFRKLAPRTQSDYQEAIDYFGDHAAELYPASMKPRHVQKIVDDAADANGWAFGDKLLSVLRLLINWGLFHEAFEPGERWAHPCDNVAAPKRDADAQEANRPWEEHERVAVVERASLEFLVLYALCLYGRMNISDAIDIPKTAIKTIRREDGSESKKIRWQRSKNAEVVDIEIVGPLAAFLDAAPAHAAATIAANSHGKRWTYAGADSARKRLLADLEEAGKVADGLTWHGLRCTFGSIAAEGGATSKAIAAGLNDKTTAMGERYSRGAKKQRLAALAVKPLFDRDQDLIQPVLARRLENGTENAATVVKLARGKST